MKILFLHGMRAAPGGIKPTFLKDHGHEVINPKLPDDDFHEATRIAQAEFDKHSPQLVVGSSRGGAVAMNFNSRSAKLVLLCPAWKAWGTANTVRPNTVILHSRNDDVIDFSESEDLKNRSGASLIEVGNDHWMVDQDSLEAMLRACEEYVLGIDYGAPATAGQQAKKVILIEAIRINARHYVIRKNGRNSRLRTTLEGKNWRDKRPGWTIPDLADSLAKDPSMTVAAFDFPFSIPLKLLKDTEFAKGVAQEVFCRRANWSKFVSDNLHLEFPNRNANAKLTDMDKFNKWKKSANNKYWVKRETDIATGASPPLKDKYQNLFAMTLAGTSMLEQLAKRGFSLVLSPRSHVGSTRVVFETYPSAVAKACGFKGSYKNQPAQCMEKVEQYLNDQGISLNFDHSVKDFCLAYRTSGQTKGQLDPDGADAFLCLVAAICYRENIFEWRSGCATPEVLDEEGCIITPIPSRIGKE